MRDLTDQKEHDLVIQEVKALLNGHSPKSASLWVFALNENCKVCFHQLIKPEFNHPMDLNVPEIFDFEAPIETHLIFACIVNTKHADEAALWSPFANYLMTGAEILKLRIKDILLIKGETSTRLLNNRS